MKRKLGVTLLISILIIILSPIIAAADHGLEWGYHMGESANFLVSINYDSNIRSGRIVSSVTWRDDIPDNITTWSNLPDMGYWMSWDDGTDITDQTFMFEFLPHVGNKRAIPLGNFSFLEELATNAFVVDSFIDDNTYWGIQSNYSYSDRNAFVTVLYAKEDGLIAQHFVNIYYTNDTLVGSVSIYREGYSPNQLRLELGNIWLLFLSGFFFVIFVVKVIKKKM